MELIGNYLSKPIISIYEASMIGTVISATFDKKMRRVCALLIVSDNEEDEILYYVPINRIITAENALTVKNRNSVRRYEESNIFVKCPINHPVYMTTGEKKGTVRDVSFDEKTFEVIEIILDSEKISAEKVASVSNSLMILKGEGFTRLQPPRARRTKKPKAENDGVKDTPDREYIPTYQATIMPQEEEEENYEEIPAETVTTVKKDERVSIPARIISDYSFLLNRLVLQDVYSTTGELIIPANTRITVQTVETARKHGKLVELTVGSRLINL